MRAAEQIKRNYVFNPDETDQNTMTEVYDARGRKLSFPREAVRECVEKSMNELCGLIDEALKKGASQYLGARSQLYLTGGGIALMRGARECLAGKVGLPVKLSAPKTAKLNSPVYSSALGLVDLTFGSIERRDEDEDSFGSKLTGFLKKRK